MKPEDDLNQAIYAKAARDLLSEEKLTEAASQGGLQSPRNTVQPNDLYRTRRVSGNVFGYATHP